VSQYFNPDCQFVSQGRGSGTLGFEALPLWGRKYHRTRACESSAMRFYRQRLMRPWVPWVSVKVPIVSFESDRITVKFMVSPLTVPR